MTAKELVDLAWEHCVPWTLAWTALGPVGSERDAALAECERLARESQHDRHCAVVAE